MSERELIAALEAAKGRLRRATAALAPKHKGGELAEFHAAHQAMMEAERALAAARKEAYAVPLDFPVQWDAGAPLPHLIQNDIRTFLICLLADTPAARDGTFVTVVLRSDDCLDLPKGSRPARSGQVDRAGTKV